MYTALEGMFGTMADVEPLIEFWSPVRFGISVLL